MKEFEYTVMGVPRHHDVFIDRLNERGRDGWELVVFMDNNYAILKRELTDANPNM